MSRTTRRDHRIVCVTAALAVATISAAGRVCRAEEMGLEALLQDARSLRLADPAVTVTEKSLTVGHLELTLVNGTVRPIKSSLGDTYGLYFDGSGVYRYTSADPADGQALPANLQRAARGLEARGNVVSDTFRRLLIFHAKPLFPDLWAGAVSGATAAPGNGAATAGFEKMWADVGRTYLEYDHLAALARMNPGGLQYVYAEIDGARERVGYSLDRVRDGRERLFAFRKYSTYDLRFRDDLSTQRADGTMPARTATLTDARIEIATDDNRAARITSDLTFEVGDGVRVLFLSLMNNRDPEVFDWQSKNNRLVLKRVSDESGHDLPFSHRYYELLVEVPPARPAGKSLRLHFETEGEILVDMNGLHADNYFELMRDAWYPRPYGRDPGRFQFALTVRTRKPWVPVTTGKQVSLEEQGDSYVLEARSEAPASQVAVFAGKYKTAEETIDGITIRVHAYAMARKNVMREMPKLAREMIRFYEGILGKYPYAELDIVEVPEYGFGIAPAGMILLTTEAYKPRQDELSSYLSRGINVRLAHEIAHQWFGHKAIPADREDDWLSESFAEYLSALAIDAAKPDERIVAGFEKQSAEWWLRARECRDTAPISAASTFGGEGAWRDRQCLLYNRGPLVLHMMHTMLGRERFQSVLRTFLDRADFGAVTTDDFAKAASEVLKLDFTWFVDQWVRHAGIPEVSLTHHLEHEAGRPILVGEAHEKSGSEFKKLIVPLAVELDNGRTETKVVVVDEPTKPFRLPLGGDPKKVRVDPARVNLAIYD